MGKFKRSVNRFSPHWSLTKCSTELLCICVLTQQQLCWPPRNIVIGKGWSNINYIYIYIKRYKRERTRSFKRSWQVFNVFWSKRTIYYNFLVLSCWWITCTVLILYNVVLLNMWHYMLWHTEKNLTWKYSHTHMHMHQPTTQLSLEINHQLKSIEDIFASLLA